MTTAEVSTAWFLPSKETRKFDRLDASHGHHSRLLAAMGGDARGWNYTGTMFENEKPTGTCACGHTGLRYQFLLKNHLTGKEILVGSTCIDHFSDVNPNMVSAIGEARDRAEKAAAARIKAANELLQDDEIKQLTKELGDAMTKAVHAVCDANRHDRTHYWFFERYGYRSNVLEMVDYDRRVNHREFRATVSMKQYKLKSALIKNLKSRIKIWSGDPIVR